MFPHIHRRRGLSADESRDQPEHLQSAHHEHEVRLRRSGAESTHRAHQPRLRADAHAHAEQPAEERVGVGPRRRLPLPQHVPPHRRGGGRGLRGQAEPEERGERRRHQPHLHHVRRRRQEDAGSGGLHERTQRSSQIDIRIVESGYYGVYQRIYYTLEHASISCIDLCASSFRFFHEISPSSLTDYIVS